MMISKCLNMLTESIEEDGVDGKLTFFRKSHVKIVKVF